MDSELLFRRCRVRFYAFFGQPLSKQLYTPCSFRLVIQFLTNVVLVLLLRRLVILRRKVKVNKASFNFRHVSAIGTILILDDSTPSLKAVSTVATKNRLVCGKLKARQNLARFDPDNKSAVLRQKIG